MLNAHSCLGREHVRYCCRNLPSAAEAVTGSFFSGVPPAAALQDRVTTSTLEGQCVSFPFAS